MADFEKRGKIWYFRFVDATGKRVRRKGCPDRRATEEMARDAETEAARIRSGSLDARELAHRKNAAKPLADHLGDWYAHLTDAGHTPKHAGLSLDRVRRVAAIVSGAALADAAPPRRTKQAERERIAERVADRLASARLADLTRDRVQSALATLRTAGLSLQTLNHHRAACRAFTRWAWKEAG